MKLELEFVEWLSGHDKETVLQMYRDWKKEKDIFQAANKRFESRLELKTEDYTISVFPTVSGRVDGVLRKNRLWIQHKDGEAMEVEIDKIWEDF